MATWIALLRGINVGGKNPLPMKSLGSVLEGLGCTDVRTFIQSGNVVFCRPRVSPASFGRQIAVSVKKEHGFEPRVLVLPAAKLEEIVAANPFPNAVSDPKSLHVFFLAKAPKKPDLAALDELKDNNESFALVGTAFYLHAPAGIARSKLAARAEKLLAVDATARNWRTVSKLLDMI